jgi:hypothetical protein
VLLTAVPLLRVFLVRSPVAYHPEGSGRGTATLKFYEGRDNLVRSRNQTIVTRLTRDQPRPDRSLAPPPAPCRRLTAATRRREAHAVLPNRVRPAGVEP